MKIIHEICSHQIQFQEETLSGLVNKNATDLQSSKELIAKDAMIIINEIPDVDLDVSNNSIEEIQFQEKYNDPQFQELLNTLKKLWKRERMLVTIYKRHVNDVEEEKESAEKALADFMSKNSVPLLDNSYLNDSNISK